MEIAAVIIVASIPIVWQARQYFDQKRQELRDRRFVAYHDLIRRLVEPEEPHKKIYLDRQIAVVYELRNFPQYREVTLRILHGLISTTWSGISGDRQRLLDEINLTIAFLEK
jgi:hypothetical protein